jgi:cyclohexadienyl dehydratase
MILDRGVLRVGTTMDTPVFSMRDPASENLRGLDMDGWNTLNSSLRRQARIREDDVPARCSPDLAADKFDIAMSGMGRTLDRARVATFSKPHTALREAAVDPQRRPGGASRRLRTDRPGLKIGYNRRRVERPFRPQHVHPGDTGRFDNNELAPPISRR